MHPNWTLGCWHASRGDKTVLTSSIANGIRLRSKLDALSQDAKNGKKETKDVIELHGARLELSSCRGECEFGRAALVFRTVFWESKIECEFFERVY